MDGFELQHYDAAACGHLLGWRMPYLGTRHRYQLATVR